MIEPLGVRDRGGNEEEEPEWRSIGGEQAYFLHQSRSGSLFTQLSPPLNSHPTCADLWESISAPQGFVLCPAAATPTLGVFGIVTASTLVRMGRWRRSNAPPAPSVTHEPSPSAGEVLMKKDRPASPLRHSHRHQLQHAHASAFTRTPRKMHEGQWLQ